MASVSSRPERKLDVSVTPRAAMMTARFSLSAVKRGSSDSGYGG
jgi:hypothetical protein